GKKLAVMGGPRLHVSGIEGGGDQVMQMRVVGAAAGRVAVQHVREIAVVHHAVGGSHAEGEVHVPGEIHGPAVIGAEINLKIVLTAGAVTIAHAKERLDGKSAQPLIHVDDLINLFAVGRAAEAENLQHFDKS